MKKIVLGMVALGTTLAVLPMFAAFEAHVINVTARIENALSVNTDPISFGTVFPQEELDRLIRLELSGSFRGEQDADDVEYVIRQKPKCGWTAEKGQVLIGQTQSGHVTDEGQIVCPEPIATSTEGAIWGPLPLLCPYLSKHPVTSQDDPSNNDGSLDAFHKIGEVIQDEWVWNDVKGRLAKSDSDFFDTWNIDLKVPCFGDHCAQDWDDFVTGINPDANPDDYVQDPDNEHKIFGCDLWIEVAGVSRYSTGTSTPQ